MDINDLKKRLAEFAKERDWDQFHSPKNLAMALAGEAGELVEIFQWLTEQESTRLTDSEDSMRAVREEAADISAEDRAAADGVGLWRDNDPVPPWEWRRAKRKKTN